MSKTVHIFFCGDGVEIPRNNDWEKFGNIDALRTYLICADSWHRNGWKINRLSTVGGTYPITPFLGAGRIKNQFHWYPERYWQFIAKAKSVAQPGLNWFVTIDVINNYFGADYFVPEPLEGCVSFQREHFSLSFFAATPEWLNAAEKILIDYDRGELPEIKGATYISDERILREYSAFVSKPLQEFASNKSGLPLTHFARSTLGTLYNQIPLSCP